MIHARRWLIRAAVLGVLALRVSAARADGAKGSGPGLVDEESLVAYALGHNPELRASHWDEDIANANVGSAAALSNPVARAEWLHVQSSADFGWGVGLSWAPPQPGVYGSRKDAARAQVRAVREDFNERAADLEAEVRRGYAQISALGEQVALAEKSVETRRALQQTVKERLAHGAANRIDLSLVAVSLARSEQEREILALSRESALTELQGLLGWPADRPLELRASAGKTEVTASASQPGGARADDLLVRQAIASRPLLRADAARAEASDETLSAERAKRWPWVELQGRYRKHDQATRPDDVTLGVDVTLPILSLNGGPIAAAEASERQQREVALAHRLGIEREVRALRAESAHRAQIADHYLQQIAPVLAEHAALVKQALAGMALDLTSVLTAEDLVTQGRIDYVEAQLAQRKAQIALSRALGAYGRARAPRTK
jgi:outer membrane protein TolC